MRCVIDSSMALAWVLPGEGTPAIDRLLSEIATDRAVVSALWLLKIANVLLLAERRGRLTAAQRSRAMLLLESLPLVVEPILRDRVWRDAFQIAAAHRLTIDDALHLEAAMRLALPLASLDDDLAQAASACGVVVLGG